MRLFYCLVALALLAAPAAAQLVPGDIGVTGFSTSQFSVIDAGGVTPYPIGSFGGSGTATSQAILWDPLNPNDFIIGGFGFIGRATITGSGAITYNTITTAVGTASQMSWGAFNQIIVADAGNDQVLRVDPVTGNVMNLTTGAQPWGTTINAGAADPATGDIYIGNSGSIYKLDSTGTVTSFATGWGLPGYVSGITFDPGTGEVVATLLSVLRLVRIDSAGNLTDLIAPGTIGTMNSVDVDANGDFIVGSSSGSVYHVPNAGGTGTLIGTATGQGSSASGVAVVGASGPPPFSLVVNAYLNGSADFTLSNIPAGTASGWTFASADTSAAVGAGWAFGINPDALTFLILDIAPIAQPGNLFHWLVSFTTVYPHVPFTFPPGTLTPLSGWSFDFVALAQDSGSFITGSSNVQRILVP